jgi:hypothetical protein
MRSHTGDPPIPNDVIVTEQIQAIHEIIDLVSDSDTEIQPMVLEDTIPVTPLGFKRETLNNKQEDEA